LEKEAGDDSRGIRIERVGLNHSGGAGRNTNVGRGCGTYTNHRRKGLGRMHDATSCSYGMGTLCAMDIDGLNNKKRKAENNFPTFLFLLSFILLFLK
jgi:hypothetical protein